MLTGDVGKKEKKAPGKKREKRDRDGNKPKPKPIYFPDKNSQKEVES